MLGMYEIGVLVVDVEEVLEHTQYEAWNGQYLSNGLKTKLMGQGYEKGYR